MAESVGPTTPIELVEAVYAKLPERVGRSAVAASGGR